MSGLERWWQQMRVRVHALTGPRIMPAHLSAPEASTRWRAIRALHQRPQPALLAPLLARLPHEDALNREAVVDVLVSWGPDMVLAPARQALHQQPSIHQATSLLNLLAQLPAAENRAVITPWLDADNLHLRAAAFRALAALGHDADVPQLAAALKTEQPAVQRGILAGLCAPAGETVLQALSPHADPILQQLAIQARARITAAMEPERNSKRKKDSND